MVVERLGRLTGWDAPSRFRIFAKARGAQQMTIAFACCLPVQVC